MNLELDAEERIYIIALLLKTKQRHITEDLLGKLNVQDHELKTARSYLN